MPGGERGMARNKVQRPGSTAPAEGRLLARPMRPAGTGTGLPGLHRLGLADARDGLLYVPSGYRPEHPAPLVVMLHGAGGNAQHGLNPFIGLADEAGVMLLAPDSRGQTWDVILGGYGPDVAFIDRALAQTFSRYAVDPTHVAAEGFSDGASYALSLGIGNGDLFTAIVAFSPGFAAPARPQGAPRIFISHGTRDDTLPVDVCSRRIVASLRRAGYAVAYREFDGPHTIPRAIEREGLAWFLG